LVFQLSQPLVKNVRLFYRIHTQMYSFGYSSASLFGKVGDEVRLPHNGPV